MSKENLYCYLRVSSQKQVDEGHSIENQQFLGKRLSKKLKMNYVEINEGPLSSVNIEKRKKYLELKDHIYYRRCKNLWFLHTTRMNRDFIEDSLFYRDFIYKFGVKVYYGENGDLQKSETVQDKQFQRFQSVVSSIDSENRRFFSVSGKRHLSRTTDKPINLYSKPRYGYKSVNKLVKIDKKTSQIVKKMYQMKISGKSVKDIKTYLDTNNISPPRKSTKTWNTRSIELILKNEGYTGFYKWVDKELQLIDPENSEFFIKYPQIISNLIFQRCKETFEENSKHRGENLRKHESLLHHLLYCECGTRFGSHTHRTIRQTGDFKNRKNTKVNTQIYYCLTKNYEWKDSKGRNCKNRRSLDQVKTNDFVISQITEVVSNSHILKEEFKTQVMSQKNLKSKEISDKIKILEKRLKRLNSDISLTDDNITSVITNELQRKITKKQSDQVLRNLRSELDSLNTDRDSTVSEIVELDNHDKWISWISKYTKDVNLKSTDKGEFIDGLIDRITVRSVFGKNRDGVSVQIGHRLKIKFKMSVVDDDLVYKDIKNKRSGYDIVEGSKTLNTERFESYNVGGRGLKKKGSEG